MAHDPIQLCDLIADVDGAINQVVTQTAHERPEATVIVKSLNSLGDAAGAGVRKACDQDLIALMIDGWGKARELREYGDPAKHPAPTSATIVLGKHPMAITVDPQLTLVVGRVLRYPLKFVVEFNALISAARLALVDGAIARVGLGSVTLGAKLRWGSTEVPLPLKSRTVNLPGEITIDPPFVIPF
jgi:hypothetical protein